MKSKSLNYLKLLKFIFNYNFFTTFLYKHCFFIYSLYIIINNYLKCVKCICCDHFYINILLKSFNCMHKKLKFKLKIIIKKYINYFTAAIKHSVIIIKFNIKFNYLFLQLKYNKFVFIFKDYIQT